MEHRAADAGWSAEPNARFGLAPPRHFLLPAVLLLLSEEPGHGYSLAKGLEELRFGRVHVTINSPPRGGGAVIGASSVARGRTADHGWSVHQ
jgi:hypothetical protein